MNHRQKNQVAFEKSGKNIEVGAANLCPIDPVILAATNEASDYVIQTFQSGLTAEVYRLCIEGKDYTLKKRRPKPGVSNIDGQYSFLNEVQRRQDFCRLKQDQQTGNELECIVDTVYANYQLGIILSPWIEGEQITDVTPPLIEQLFSTLIACEKAGLMEWDLCSGNMLVDNTGKLTLFDFGYMYPVNPCTEFNSNGVNDPIFHMAERFETRFYFGWLLTNNVSRQGQLDNYRIVKQLGVKAFESKIRWLVEQNADNVVVNHFERIVNKWREALANTEELGKLFRLESFRSHVLDIEDDLHGKSCTSITAMRVDYVLHCLEEDYDDLLQQGGFFYQNSDKSKDELIQSYKEKQVLVARYQSK